MKKFPRFVYDDNNPLLKEEHPRLVPVEENTRTELSWMNEQCRTNPKKSFRRQSPAVVWSGRNLCSSCAEGWNCGMASSTRTRCAMYKKEEEL